MESNESDVLLNLILDDNLPNGILKHIPFNTYRGVSFSYRSEQITLSPIYVNKFLQCYFFDMKWDAGNKAIYSIPLKCGINIMEQYKQSPISNLYAFDTNSIGSEVKDYNNMVLYMIDETIL